MEYLNYKIMENLKDMLTQLNVSQRARKADGFYTVYIKNKGNLDVLSKLKYPGKKHSYLDERNQFIARHLVQYKKNPTDRRRLALIAWAFLPN